jgi:hypothetical protein
VFRPIGTSRRRVGVKAGFARVGIVRSHVVATGIDYDDLLFVRR